MGKIAYINSIEDGFKNKMLKYITDIIAKSELTGDQTIVDAFNQNKLFSELPDMRFVQVDDFLYFTIEDY